ncbi:MAG: hypothetical protein ACRBN8_46920 [Nannocystales bacterium]
MAGDVSASSEEALMALEGVGRIEGELRVSGGVKSLGALACLEEVGGRLVIERTELRDLSGLENLVAAESLVLSGNAELVSTKGLGVQSLVGEIDELSGYNTSQSEIVGNHQLTELRFDSLQEIGTMAIGHCGSPETRIGNDSLAELGAEAFPVLESAVTLGVASNQSLRSVDGLVDKLGPNPPFLTMFFSDNPDLDGPMFRERWVELGLDDRFLVTCGNGDEEACMCAVTE